MPESRPKTQKSDAQPPATGTGKPKTPPRRYLLPKAQANELVSSESAHRSPSGARLQKVKRGGGPSGASKVVVVTKRFREDLDQVRSRLAGIAESEEGERWLRTPNTLFGNRTPTAVIRAGRTELVLQAIARVEEGIHV